MNSVVRAFIGKKIEWFLGLWLIVCLVLSVLLFALTIWPIGSDGRGFIDLWDRYHAFPYATLLVWLGFFFPFMGYVSLATIYPCKTRYTIRKKKGTIPCLPYSRNRVFCIAKMARWIALFGVLVHVGLFCYVFPPLCVPQRLQNQYLVALSMDDGLYGLSYRLGCTLYDRSAVEAAQKECTELEGDRSIVDAADSLLEIDSAFVSSFSSQKEMIAQSALQYRFKEAWVQALGSFALQEGQVVVSSSSAGTLMLLVLREYFSFFAWKLFYTIFVVASCVYAADFVCRFLYVEGYFVRRKAGVGVRYFLWIAMVGVAFLGGSVVWGIRAMLRS